MFARPFRVEFIRRFSAQAAYINKFGFIYYVFGLISMRIINVYVRMGGPRGLGCWLYITAPTELYLSGTTVFSRLPIR
jgi:hypothetical protein